MFTAATFTLESKTQNNALSTDKANFCFPVAVINNTVLITYCSIAEGVWKKHEEPININLVTVDEFSEALLQRYTLMQPRPQGLLAFQNGGGSGEDPGT